MSRITSSFTPAGRDAGLRRLRIVNRMLIGATVAVTGLLTDVAAQAFPGHKRVIRASVATPPGRSLRTVGPARHRHAVRRRAHAHRKLRPPAQAPSSVPATTSATVQSAPSTTSAPASPAPASPAPASPAPAAAAPAPVAPAPVSPAPVVSGGS
jgi:hypothetical protein